MANQNPTSTEALRADLDAKNAEIGEGAPRPRRPAPAAQGEAAPTAAAPAPAAPQAPAGPLPAKGYGNLQALMTKLNVEVDGYYVPVIELPNGVKQLSAFQGIPLVLKDKKKKGGRYMIVRLTVPTFAKNLLNVVAFLPAGAHLFVEVRSEAEELSHYLPRDEYTGGVRRQHVYEMAYIPVKREGLTWEGHFFGTELSQEKILEYRVTGIGSMLSPGGMFSPSNISKLLELSGALKDEDVAL